jgi:hypothetical protein
LYANHTRQAKELGRSKPEEVAKPKPKEMKEPPSSSLSTSNSRSGSERKDASEFQSSFLLLYNKTTDRKSDDPFERFWEQVEGLVINGAPASEAFTAQLGKSRYMQREDESQKLPDLRQPANSGVAISSLQNTQASYINLDQYSYIQKPSHSQFPQKGGTMLGKRRTQTPLQSNMLNSYLIVDNAPTHPKTMEEYELENKQLKNAVDMLTQEQSKLERIANDHQALQNSVLQFRQTFDQKRNMASSSTESMRVGELERQVRDLKLENVGLKDEIERYKSRWERLKESAKRKKEQKAGVDWFPRENESSLPREGARDYMTASVAFEQPNNNIYRSQIDRGEPKEEEELESMYFSSYSKRLSFDE